MTSFLSDLHRYRTRNKQHREDYLSTCMAELMRRDQVACRAILRTLQLDPPDPLRPRVIHTQIILPGTRDRPDVRVRIGAGSDRWEALIECKVDALAELSQVRRYQQGGHPVAFLAPSKTIDRLDDDWEEIPRGSWQELHAALVRESSRVDPDQVPAFRRDFIGLLEAFGLASLPGLSPRDVRGAVAATSRLSGLSDLLREAVRAISPPGLVYAPHSEAEGRTAGWDSEQLGAGWESDKSPVPGLMLEGLWLEATMGDGVGDDALRWELHLYPTKKLRKKSMGRAEELGFQDPGPEDYWELVLREVGDPVQPFRDQVVEAVHEARAVLKELGCKAGSGEPILTPGIGAEPLPGVAHAIRTVDETTDALERWRRELRERLLAALLAAGFEARDVRSKKRRLRVKVGSDTLDIGSWLWLEPEGSHIGVWFSTQPDVSHAVVGTVEHDTIQVRVGKNGKFDLLLPVTDHAVDQLVPDAVGLAVRVMQQIASTTP